MKKILLIIFVLLFIAQSLGQAVDESFDNFYFTFADDTVGAFVFDSTYRVDVSGDSLHESIVGNANDMTIGGWADYAALESAISDSAEIDPNYSSGYVLPFVSGSSEYFHVASADFDPGISDLSLEAWVNPEDLAGNSTLIAKFESSDYYIFMLSSGEDVVLQMKDDDASTFNSAWANSNLPIGEWTHLVLTVDRNDSARLYINGVFHEAKVHTVDGNIEPSGDFMIGGRGGGGDFYNGYISEIRYYKKKLSAAEIRRVFGLASGWYSKAGNVTREFSDGDPLFHQGFYDGDTVYFPVSDRSNSLGNWQLSVSAKGTKSGDALTAWIGGGTAKTQTLTTSSTTYTLDLGAVTLSGDSLWFSASASDTAYINNVTVTDVSLGYENRFPIWPDWPFFP